MFQNHFRFPRGLLCYWVILSELHILLWFVEDAEGLTETGRFYGVSPVSIEGVAHDMMLDCSWEKGAQVILAWLHALDREQPA